MITDNHIEYLHDVLTPDDGYPHQFLWLDAEKYALYNEFSLNGMYFANRHRLENAYAWENRYSSLRQDTIFFKNLLKCSIIRNEVHNDEYAWKIILDLQDVPIEKAIFEIFFVWSQPTRFFSFD